MTKDLQQLVIDGRDMTRTQVCELAQKAFGIQTIQEDQGPNPGDHGFFLARDPLHYYHVQSVLPGIYVASRTPMTPDQTRPLVQDYLKEMEHHG